MKRYFAILPCLLLAACHHEAKPEKTITPVRVIPVSLYQPKAGGGRYSATILPARQVNLAFRVSGIVAGLHNAGGRNLEPGDFVSPGTVLATLREEDYRISNAQSQGQLDAARETQRSAAAQLAQAEANRAKAAADFTRAKDLLTKQSLTQPEYDAAKAQIDATSAQVNAARAQLESTGAQIRTAEANLAAARLAQRDAILVAPFHASVVQRGVELGMLAGPSQIAYTLADIATVKAAFGVPDTVMVQLRRGRSISITVEAWQGREFAGTITTIPAVADSSTRLYQVEVTLPNSQLLLKPGMIASLRLDESGAAAPAVPVIPLSAVIRDPDNPSNFSVMVVENKMAKARPVALGPTFGDLLAVNSGVKPGELVIRTGGTLVSSGETVEVIP
jgi:RND family efflux transporter MFP subunit